MIHFSWKDIEKKWQKRWEEAGIFKVKEDPSKKKVYVLEMFPYPSAYFLHMGHVRNYTIGDVIARYLRMRGFNVLYPMGYDAFGLPAENAAIQTGIHPKVYTENAIEKIMEQQKKLGLSYDWSRVIATCYPEYYKWNQWFFLKFLEKGLAYRKKAPVNWCPKCKTVLANEQVEHGKCWRCNSKVEIKHLEQWFFKITAYAERLLKDLEKIDWPENIKEMQRNWIGKSEGAEIVFKIEGENKEITVFTTRADTIFGVSFIALAPEHPLVEELVKGTELEEKVKEFARKVVLEERFERTEKKEGMFLGKYAIHPITGEKIPIWIANFVLMEYGYGAVMGVPAHDQRDFEFAKKYNLPIKIVVRPENHELKEPLEKAFEEDGILVNSGEFTGLKSAEARKRIIEFLEKIGKGKKAVQYKLRDWLISRQRYWGTPIPVVYCEKCGIVPVPEDELPVVLPENVKFTGEGNPLEKCEEWVNTICPKCKGKAKRETDTMDTFVDSSWYFLRYCSPKENSKPFDENAVKYWMPVDIYIGGAEHAVMHLLYARFFTKVLYDLGLIDFEEPFLKLFNQGIVYKDGAKMSKSKGNVVTPDEISEKYGIDTARFFLMFVASPDKQMEWTEKGIEGAYRFIKRFIDFILHAQGGDGNLDELAFNELKRVAKAVAKHIENFEHNLALKEIVIFVDWLREIEKHVSKELLKKIKETLVLLLCPFTPHICEELWEKLGKKPFASIQPWPELGDEQEKISEKKRLLENIIEDIREIEKIIGKKPEKITIYVAKSWKYEILRIFEKEKDQTIKIAMQREEFRKLGNKVVKFIEFLKKKRYSCKLSKEDEIDLLEKAKSYIAELFSCEVIVKDGDIVEKEKAEKAIPGKPGIEVE
ncbi:MAG TPA: leucine--tRNA ligase [Nanoarchaeota archaeon]|nr:leucine--tRNA ligase [Nanoarchaeota archaeon]